MEKFSKKMKEVYKETKKSSLLVYLILRGLVLVCMVLQIIHGNFMNAFLCVLSLILFVIPFLIQHKFKITLPNTLEIIIFLFIFSAEILGEIQNFYGIIPYWDTLLHTLNGFLCAGIGFSLVDILNRNSQGIKLSSAFVALVAFCFSMTIGVLWEFFEFGCDYFFRMDMQKDRIVETISSVTLNEEGKNKTIIIDEIESVSIVNSNGDVYKILGGYLDIGLIDTMKDLLVNFIGAVCFSIFGYLYILNRDKYVFARHFIPTVNTLED